MGVLKWLLRCIPGLSILLLLILLECALKIAQTEWISFTYPPFLVDQPLPLIAQSIFIVYTLLLHILVLVFPVRLCYSVWTAASQIKSAHGIGAEAAATNSQHDSISHSLLDLELREHSTGEYCDVTMAVIIPSYKEDIGTLEDTLRVLASHDRAKSSYDVFLAMEERDPTATKTARSLVEAFGKSFQNIQHTMHPANLPGETPGKSSNVSWAARVVEKKYMSSAQPTKVLVTVMDSDTHLLAQYFDILRRRHLRNCEQGEVADTTLYMPPIVFDRNAHLVPRFVRVADLMWCGAGLSSFSSRPSPNSVGIPTAVYTVPVTLVSRVGGWDTGSEAIGEDMHMMLKCYFATNGRLRVESIASPASQCNVTTGQEGIRGWISDHFARYAQALRHMWGCLDTGYAVRQWCRTLRIRNSSKPESPRRHIPRANKTPLVPWRHFVLFTRLFEAHFLPIHLFLVLIASALYTSLPYPLSSCRLLSIALDATGYLRAGGFFAMTIYFVVFYERYHEICVRAREHEMRKAELYHEMAHNFSHRGRWKLTTLVDYVLFPVAGTIFGSVPLFQASISHFWSENLVYLVSAKPLRKNPGQSTGPQGQDMEESVQDV